MRRLLNPYLVILLAGYSGILWSDTFLLFQESTISGAVYGVSLIVVLVGLFLAMAGVAARYKLPHDSRPLPSVSVLIPVLNEERYIFDTLCHVSESEYPSDSLEILLINDGSTDNTVGEVSRFNQSHPPVTLLDFSENRGKREALISGIEASSGEIIVFLDSDTMMEPDALRLLVSSIGPATTAVCGEVLVGNKRRSVATRLQEFDYFISFNFFKAFESRFGAVTCAPGCFSAYKRQAVLDVLREWTDQYVLGTAVSYGEDRFLTSLLLRRGEILYQSAARAHTIVPDTFRSLVQQRLRWSRSWFINSLEVGRFMWQKPWAASLTFYLIFISTLFVPAWVAGLALRGTAVGWLALMFLLGLGACQLGVALIKKRRGLLRPAGDYLLAYFMILLWLVPLSIASIANNSWGSRRTT